MSRKLALCLVTLAIASIAMLVLRQQRLVAVADMTTAANKAAELDRLLWRARVEIGELTSIERIEALAQALESEYGALEPLAPVHRTSHEPSVAMLDDAETATP